MCGICGFISKRAGAADEALLQAMNGALFHRGPDEDGTFLTTGEREPAVGLAMRRLSIIDLSTGRQPIPNEDESIWIVFNGEIYNHQELRRDLEAAGHRFRTRSDTEAILHAYEEYGDDCVRRLRGMFAFAIWDRNRQRLLVARDHVGIKPLYWTEVGDRLLFASEIKSLFREPKVRREVNREALHHYLTYLYTPPPATMFAGIYQLPPGHRLIWERGKHRIEEYWSGPESVLQSGAAEPATSTETWNVLREAVEAHMLADVPLGAFLSGGLDSTAIVALMAEISSQPVKTFSVGFEAAGLYDEREHARAIARHFRTDHYEFAINEGSVSLLPSIVRFLDEPLADASVIPNYLVAQTARQHVKVALSGAGGDELFGGYRRYFGNEMARKWERLPGSVRKNLLLPALRMVPATGDTALGDASRLAQKFLEPLDLTPERRYLAWNAFFSEESKRALYGSASSAPESASLMLSHFEKVRHREFPDQAMYVDLKSYLPGDPLFLSDRMTMANSLEARVPFVDTRVMEFAGRLPVAQKIQGRLTKRIIREMLAGRIPEQVVRRPKRGFGTPIDLWMKGKLSRLVNEALSPALLRDRGYFSPEYVAWLREQQAAGKRDFSQHIWALFVFELWHRTFIDQDLSDRTDLGFDDLGFSAEAAAAVGSRASGKSPAPGSAPQASADVSVPAEPARSEPAVPRSGKRLSILMTADVDPVHVIGGAERMLNEHSTRLAAAGHRVVVLTRRENEELPAEEEHRGVRVVRHPIGGAGPIGFVRSVIREGGAAFERLLQQEQFDLINIHQPLAAAAVLRRPQSRSLPVLYTYLSPWSDEYRVRFSRKTSGKARVVRAAAGAWMQLNSHLRERMEREALRRANGVLVLSEFSASQIRDIHRLPTDNARVIPGGVNVERFRPARDRKELRTRLGMPEGFVLFTVRNLVPRMGLDSLLAAMSRVVEAQPDAMLYIGGTGPLREPLEAQARESGLAEHVRFLGFLPEEQLPDYYAAADLFVLPTRCLEGFGLVTVEALASGTPALGTPIGGTREILQRFDSDFLFAGIEEQAIADRLVEKIPEIRGNEVLRAKCRRFATEHFAWDAVVPQVEAQMLDLVARRAAAAS